MKAADVMGSHVITVGPEATVAEAAKLMATHDVSALPVVDADGKLIGIVSEADLMRREEIGTEIHHPWWVEAMTPATTLAEEFAKSHGKHVEEVMSEDVITATEDTPVAEIAAALERNRIKRLPIVRDGKPVGIVSRANFIQALASSPPPADGGDQTARSALRDLKELEDSLDRFRQPQRHRHDGEVHLWGLVGSEAEHKALIALAESVPGRKTVVDEMIPAY